MKKRANNFTNKTLPVILTFVILLSLTTFCDQVEGQSTNVWTDISANLPEAQVLHDVYAIGNNVWIVGGDFMSGGGYVSKLFYSPNAGDTFTAQTVPANSGVIESIFVKNDFTGYAVTNVGRILYSADARAGDWSTIGAVGGLLCSVSFPPSGTGYACGSSGRIYRIDGTTVDLDTTISTCTFTSITSPVAGESWVCGGAAIRYRNASGWDIPNYDNGDAYNAIYFIDNKNGWAVGDEGEIARTTNGFDWVMQTNSDINSLKDVFFLNINEGWAVGTNLILHTINGGATWTQELSTLTSGREFVAVFFTSPTNGYILGNGETPLLFKTGDASASTSIPTPSPTVPEFPPIVILPLTLILLFSALILKHKNLRQNCKVTVEMCNLTHKYT